MPRIAGGLSRAKKRAERDLASSTALGCLSRDQCSGRKMPTIRRIFSSIEVIDEYRLDEATPEASAQANHSPARCSSLTSSYSGKTLPDGLIAFSRAVIQRIPAFGGLWSGAPFMRPSSSKHPDSEIAQRRGRFVPVADPPITGRPMIGSGGSTPFCCAAQFNVGFLRS